MPEMYISMESNILNSHVISIEEKKRKDVAQEFYHLLRVLPHDIHSKEISSHEFLHKWCNIKIRRKI
jgi:hypothetical protein